MGNVIKIQQQRTIRTKNKNHIQSLVPVFDRKHEPLGINDCEWQNAAAAII